MNLGSSTSSAPSHACHLSSSEFVIPTLPASHRRRKINETLKVTALGNVRDTLQMQEAVMVFGGGPHTMVILGHLPPCFRNRRSPPSAWLGTALAAPVTQAPPVPQMGERKPPELSMHHILLKMPIFPSSVCLTQLKALCRQVPHLLHPRIARGSHIIKCSVSACWMDE